jgi:hypothetical protein
MAKFVKVTKPHIFEYRVASRGSYIHSVIKDLKSI